jgi:hypothetical protein
LCLKYRAAETHGLDHGTQSRNKVSVMKEYLSYFATFPSPKPRRTWSIWFAIFPYLYLIIAILFAEPDKTKFTPPNLLSDALIEAPVWLFALAGTIAAIFELIRSKERTPFQTTLSVVAIILAVAISAFLVWA